MFPPFSQELARHYCQEIISDLQDGFLNLIQVSQESQERRGHGFMLGALVCFDKITSERIILVVNSGISAELRTVRGETEYVEKGLKHIIVPPVVSPYLIEQALCSNDKKIHELTDEINRLKESRAESELQKLLCERTALTDQSLQKVFDLYEFTSFDGKKIKLNQIIKKHGGKLPPTGTGDCCAPKLLSYAFAHNLQPLSMDEVFYGRDTKNKISGKSYAPCDERCGYILPYILGLEIIYRDREIIVINKPSGLLSVPGRTEDKQDCVVSRVKKLFPECISQPSVHRLDMETSGLLVLAFTEKSHRELNRQFEEGLVQKKYCALLDGILEKAPGLSAPEKGERTGTLKLKFRLDTENRPHQIYDEALGKEGITDWENKGTVIYENPWDKKKRHVTKIIYSPKTGRTHQLRLCSSDIHGFGLPIIGDSLYGKCEEGQRLMLNAFELSFIHPVSGERLQYNLISDKF